MYSNCVFAHSNDVLSPRCITPGLKLMSAGGPEPANPEKSPPFWNLMLSNPQKSETAAGKRAWYSTTNLAESGLSGSSGGFADTEKAGQRGLSDTSPLTSAIAASAMPTKAPSGESQRRQRGGRLTTFAFPG